MRALLYFLLLLVLFGCKSYQVATQPVEVQAPDSLPDPQSGNGWVFSRTSMNGGVFLPPQPVAGKVKNSHNTDNSQKKSNNTETTDKSKDKEKVIESGNTDSNNTAKNAGVIGDNSRSDQKKGVPPALLYIILGLVAVGIIYYIIRRFFRLPRKGS